MKLISRVIERDGVVFEFDLYELDGCFRLFLDDELLYELGVEVEEAEFNIWCEIYVTGYGHGYGQGETDEYMRNN